MTCQDSSPGETCHSEKNTTTLKPLFGSKSEKVNSSKTCQTWISNICIYFRYKMCNLHHVSMETGKISRLSTTRVEKECELPKQTNDLIIDEYL